MKYTKPKDATGRYALSAFVDSLPAEFEIVEPGMTQVRWPDGVTRSELDGWCDDLTRYVPENADILRYLRALAAIAPEEKKPEKLRVYIVQFQGHGENHGKLELSFNPNPQFPYFKVGECEVIE